MSDLNEQFRDAQARILSRPLGGTSTAVNILTDILRTVNGGHSTKFNFEALMKHGIDPAEFRAAQAMNFVKNTLDYHDSPGPAFIGNLVNRLEQCLEAKDEWSFVHFLPDDLKQRAQEKLDRNKPHLRSAEPKPSR